MNKQSRTKSIRIIVSCFCICLAVFFIFCQKTKVQNSQVNSSVENFITKQALDNKAEEANQARKILEADLNGDENEEVIVLYTLESFGGTNLYIQYLAVFSKSENNKLEFITQKKIGGKNIRAVELGTIDNGIINLTVWDYLPTDASCCPSQKGEVQLKFRDGKLIEIQR